LNEPEHYAHGTKTTEHAQGEVEDQSVSTLGALKDKTLGSIKGAVGSITGNQDLELKGKAQNIHGRNEAEFAKAQKEGLTEPEHFGQASPYPLQDVYKLACIVTDAAYRPMIADRVNRSLAKNSCDNGYSSSQ